MKLFRSMVFALQLMLAGAVQAASPTIAPSMGDDGVYEDISQYPSVQGHYEEDYKNDLYLAGDRLTAVTRRQLPHVLDLSYGSDAKQELDIYLPNAVPRNAPVLIFIHGGGFVEGDRSHYGFIARPYAAHGVITAIIDYRLTGSGAIYPTQVEDTRRAIRWIYNHIGEYGGNPNQLFLSGHSAGAVLSAEIGADLRRGADAVPTRSILGIAAISGTYDLRNEEGYSNYVPTPILAASASPALHLIHPCDHWVIGFGTKFAEEAHINQSSRGFVEELRSKTTDVQEVEVAGAGHIGAVMAFGTPGTELSARVLKMIDETTRL